MRDTDDTSCQLRLRFVNTGDIALGPGKVDLLEAVECTGSISQAARRMDMSYRRAWLLINTMNHCFSEPLVRTSRGGDKKGGASLSDLGRDVVKRYRRLERDMLSAGEQDIQALCKLISAASGGREDEHR